MNNFQLPTIQKKNIFNKTLTLKKEDSFILTRRTNQNKTIRSKSYENSKSSRSLLKIKSEEDLLEIFPTEAIFRDIIPKQIYEIVINVRNLSNISKRIKVLQPESSYFRCDYDLKGIIAPGLPLKLIVSFETHIIGNFVDKLTVYTDKNIKKEIKLFAFPPNAQILFEPFINFGFVEINKEKIEKIAFKNEGKTTGKIEIVNNLPNVNVNPSSFKILPKEIHYIEIVFRYIFII